ncbi:unnamed protein product [Fusarium equiseti]|uniref:Uncharacterized protein n=1 Tax=Fusarium equiseti TaxID=61235 RepID=A0A8J2NFX8_FUSEQ|nr:unnamed protein product [Fusarium equiseti]
MASTTKPSRRPGGCERVFRTKTSSIPNLTTLRKQLGYGNPGGEQDLAFKKAVAEQVKTFVSSVDSLPAFKLTKWKNRVHQRGLLEVTKNFLKVKGTEFWPDWRSDLNYKRDSSKIRRLMTQVFWRTACEKKRAKSSTSPNVQLFQTRQDALQQPVKTEESSSVTESLNEPSQFVDRGNTADNPIDLEDMTSNSNTNIPGTSTDNDPFMDISIRFSRYPPDEDNLQESITSELFTSSLLSPDAIDGQPLDTTDNHQTAPSNDTWAVPPSPPRATSAAVFSNRKRPAGVSSDNNPGQNKKRGGSSNLLRKQARSKTVPTASRASNRQKKQVVREDCATEAQMRAFDNSSSLASSQSNTTSEVNNEVQQGQQSNGQAQGQVPQASSSGLRDTEAPRGFTREQSSAELLRAAAGRQARADTEAAAEAVGVKDSSRVTTGLSITAQGKQPEIPSRQAQAGPSREREMIERLNPGAETTASQTTGNSYVANGLGGTDLSEERGSGRFYFNELEQEALQSCELIYETDIGHAGDWTVMRLSDTIFQLSLANVFDELRLIDSAALHLHFGRGRNYIVEQFRRGQSGEKKFAAFKERCLVHITYQRRHAASALVVQGRGVNYFVKFSDGPIKLEE